MLRIVCALATILFFGGCAHLTTYQSDIGTPTTGVSMDAKQRLVLVNSVSSQRRMCAEPSPDALSALGASLGASLVTGTSTKQLAAALGESSASIGLRTTSIQLMRDAMYRACEAYLSDGIKADEYADLQAHSQTLVVGLLAIEQLTGAVQAQQVAVMSNAGAGTGGDVTQEAADLTEKKKETLNQKLAAADAAKEQDALDKQVAAKQDEVDKAKADDATTAEDQAKLDEQLLDLQKADADATTEAKRQAGLLEIAQQAQAIAQQAYDMARVRLRGLVSGDAKFSQQTRGNMSDATAQVVADSITKIVASVVGVGIESQRCLKLLSKPLPAMPKEQIDELLKLCSTADKKEKTKIELLRQQFKLPL